MIEIIAALDAVLAQFDTDEHLSVFELGQADGLRWAKQIVEEIKKPARLRLSEL
tara:strand:+ start:3827 stop:3988 length:162 start_codon:yes stop_codon:yes gene_type:complete